MSTTTTVQQMYVAYFTRAADPFGLEFWRRVLDADPANLASVVDAFSRSDEYTAMYGPDTNFAVVDKVYQNLFGRASEKAGVDFWVQQLDKGTITLGNVVTAIAQGAQGNDDLVFDGRVSVASAITAAIDTAQEILAYAGTNANELVRHYIATVKDAASLAAALDPAAIDALIASLESNPGPFPPPVSIGVEHGQGAALAVELIGNAGHCSSAALF
jgi:hypothetical protein